MHTKQKYDSMKWNCPTLRKEVAGSKPNKRSMGRKQEPSLSQKCYRVLLGCAHGGQVYLLGLKPDMTAVLKL